MDCPIMKDSGLFAFFQRAVIIFIFYLYRLYFYLILQPKETQGGACDQYFVFCAICSERQRETPQYTSQLSKELNTSYQFSPTKDPNVPKYNQKTFTLCFEIYMSWFKFTVYVHTYEDKNKRSKMQGESVFSFNYHFLLLR